MYAKIFTQIFDSSIAEDYQVRLVFEDLIKLADINGVVDMTQEAIARRTNVPLEIVHKGIKALESPDPKSRNPKDKGVRIKRIDSHRDWGWFIVNHDYYRGLKTEEERRQKTRDRVRKHRERKALATKSVTCVTPGYTALASASASEYITREGESEGKGEFTWDAAKKWLETARRNGADYSEVEARSAFLALQASGWRWGRNPVLDHRAAIERQIQTDRDRRPAGKPKDGPPENSTLAEIARMDRMIDRL